MKSLLLNLLKIAPGVLLLSACATPPDRSSWKLPGDQHKIVVKETSERLALEAGPGDAGLSLAQKSRITRFVQAWQDQGRGPIAITIPAGSANAQTAVVIAAETREMLYEHGLSWQQMVGGHYQSSEHTAPPVILSFRKYEATARGCSVSRENLAISYNNAHAKNFGCALAVNTAAMIADPHDLIAPRDQDASSSERRLVTYGKYIEGEVTGVERSSDESASVSDAVE